MSGTPISYPMFVLPGCPGFAGAPASAVWNSAGETDCSVYICHAQHVAHQNHCPSAAASAAGLHSLSYNCLGFEVGKVMPHTCAQGKSAVSNVIRGLVK